MPITSLTEWNEWVKNNTDDYGWACIRVASRVMEILDEEPGPFVADKLIMRADKELNISITGFMAGAVACMVSQCHSRGEEFRKLWNKETQISDEGDKANESNGVLNPAIITIG